MSAPDSFVRMFQPRFAALVEAGVKCQTVRPTPARIPKPGDKISLRRWTGKPYRSPQRLLRDAVVSEVFDITINTDGVFLYEIGRGGAAGVPDRDSFAMDDGFANWSDMRMWFENAHGLPFTGILIRWKCPEAEHLFNAQALLPVLTGYEPAGPCRVYAVKRTSQNGRDEPRP